MQKVDYIIVGQGISGSCLAFELIKRGKRVVVFDDNWHDAACLVAAGVINPITGQRLVKSWRSEIAHPYARKFYVELEKQLGAKFFHDRKILQLCRSQEESELWQRRSLDSNYAAFMSDASSSAGAFGKLNDKYGSHFIERSAWVEPPAVMEAFKVYLIANSAIRCEKFDYSALHLTSTESSYKDLTFAGIIFADGWKVLENPYFNWLPYRPAKGEILTLRSSIELPEHIVHRGGWIMKCGEQTFRIGSTWEREKLDSNPTESAKIELLKLLKTMFVSEIETEVVKHSAGVRPCTATTRPHLGVHPADNRIFSFNGFGSKGCALSPYFAKHFADYLLGNAELDAEANLARHIRKFFRQK